MKKLLLAVSMMALVGCASPQQKMEMKAVKALHKAERVERSKEAIFTAATALQAKTIIELHKARKDRKAKEEAVKKILGFTPVEK